MDRDYIEAIFGSVRNLSEMSEAKKALLQKNRAAITDKDGRIPEKYQRAFSKLEQECERMGKKLDSDEGELVKVVQLYVKENAMGNLVFEADNDGTQFFEDVYAQLLDANFKKISAAVDKFDLKKVDEIVQAMRTEFLNKTFSKYRQYAKTLSFNKNKGEN